MAEVHRLRIERVRTLVLHETQDLVGILGIIGRWRRPDECRIGRREDRAVDLGIRQQALV